MSLHPRYPNLTFEREPELRSTPNLLQLNTANKFLNEQFPNQNFNGISRKRPTSKAGPASKKKRKTGILDRLEEEKVLDNDLLDIAGSINANRDTDSDSSTESIHIDDTVFIDNSAGIGGKDVKVQHLTKIKTEPSSDDGGEVKVQHLTTIEKEVKNNKQDQMKAGDSLLRKLISSPPNTLSLPVSCVQEKIYSATRDSKNQLFTQQRVTESERTVATRKVTQEKEFKQKSANVTITLSPPSLKSDKNCPSFYESMGLDEDLCDSQESAVKTTSRNVEIEKALNVQVKTEIEEFPFTEITSSKRHINVRNQKVPNDELHVSMTFEAEPASEDDFDDDLPLSVLKKLKTSDQIDSLAKSESFKTGEKMESGKVNANVSVDSDRIINGIPLIKEELIEEEIETVVSYGKPQNLRDVFRSDLQANFADKHSSPVKIKTEPVDNFLWDKPASNELNAGQEYINISSSVESLTSESDISVSAKKAIASDNLLKKSLKTNPKTRHGISPRELEKPESNKLNAGQEYNNTSSSAESLNSESNTSVTAKKAIASDNLPKTSVKTNKKTRRGISPRELAGLAEGLCSVFNNSEESRKALLHPQDFSKPENTDAVNKRSPKANKKRTSVKRSTNLLNDDINLEKFNSELQLPLEFSSVSEGSTKVVNKRTTKINKKKSRAKKNTDLLYEDIGVDQSMDSEFQSPIELYSKGENIEVVNKKPTKSNKKKTSAKKNSNLIYDDINADESNSDLGSSTKSSYKPENTDVLQKSIKLNKRKINAKKNSGLIYGDTGVDKLGNFENQSPIEFASKPEEKAVKSTKSNKKKSVKKKSNQLLEDNFVDKITNSETESPIELVSKKDEKSVSKESIMNINVSTSEENNKENETEGGKMPEKKVDENLPISLLIRRHTTSDDAEGTFECMAISNRTPSSESTSNSTTETASISSYESSLSYTRKNRHDDIYLNSELFNTSKQSKQKKKRLKQNKKVCGNETGNSFPLNASNIIPTDLNLSVQGEERLFSLHNESQLDDSQSTAGSLASTIEDFSSISSNSAFDVDSSVVSKKKKRRPRSFGWNKKKKKRKGKNVSAAEFSLTEPDEEPNLRNITLRTPVVVLPRMNTLRNISDKVTENLPSNETSSLPKGRRKKIATSQKRKLSATQLDSNSLDKCADSLPTSELNESSDRISDMHVDAPKVSDIDSRSHSKSDSVSESVVSSNNNNSISENLSQYSNPNSQEISSTENNLQRNPFTGRSWKLTPVLNVQEIAKDIAQFEALLEKRTNDTPHTNSEQNVNSVSTINDRNLNQTQGQFQMTEKDSDISCLDPLEANLNSRLNNNRSTAIIDSNVNKNQSLSDDIVEIKQDLNTDYLVESAEHSGQSRSSSLNPFRMVLSENESAINRVFGVSNSELNSIPNNEQVSPVPISFLSNYTNRPASTVNIPNQRIATDNFESERNLSSTGLSISENSSAVNVNHLGLSIKKEVSDVAKEISSNSFAIRDQDDLINKACGSKSIQSRNNHFNSSSVSAGKSQEHSIDEIQILSSDEEENTCPNSAGESRKGMNATALSGGNFTENCEHISLNKHNTLTSLTATATTSDSPKHKTGAIDVGSKSVEISGKRNLFDARMLYLLAMKNKDTEYLKHPYPPTVVSSNKKLKSKNKAYERISSKSWNLTIEEVKSRLMNSENTISELENETSDVTKLEKYAISSSEVGCYHRILGVAPSHKLLSKCSPNKLNEIIDRVISDSNRRNNALETNLNEIGLLDYSNAESSHTFSNPIAVCDLPSVAEKSNVQFDASIARLCRRSEKAQDEDSKNSNKFLPDDNELTCSSDIEVSSWSSAMPSFHNSVNNSVFNTDVFCAKPSDHQLSMSLNSNSSTENSTYSKQSDHQLSTYLNSNSSGENSTYAKQSDLQQSTCLNSNSSRENSFISKDILANLALPSLETVNQLLNSNKTNQTPFVETVSNSSIESVNSAVHRDSPSLSNKHLPVVSVPSDMTAIQSILNTIFNPPVVSVTSEMTVNKPQSTPITDKHIPVESEALKVTTDASQTLSTNNPSSGRIDFPVIELRKILETVHSSSVSSNLSDDNSGFNKSKETYEYNHTQSFEYNHIQSIPPAPGDSDISEKGSDSQNIPLESCETAAKQCENENSDDDFIDAEPMQPESDMETDDNSSHEIEEEPAPIPQYKSKWEKIMERKSQELKEKQKINDFYLKDCIAVSSLKKPLLKKSKNNKDTPQPEIKKGKKPIESDAEVQSDKSKKNTKKKSKVKSPSKAKTRDESITEEVPEKPEKQKNKSVENKNGTSDFKRKLSSETEDTSNLFLPDKLVKNSSAKKSTTAVQGSKKSKESNKSKLVTDNKTQDSSKPKFYGNRVTNRGTFLTETSPSEISKQKKFSKKKLPEATKKPLAGQSEEFHSIIKSPDISINPSPSTSKNQNKSLELQKKTEFLYRSPLSNSLPSKTSHFIRTKRMRDKLARWDSSKTSRWDSSKPSHWNSSNTYNNDNNSKNSYSDKSLNNKDEVNRRNFMDTSSGHTSNRKTTLLETPKAPLLDTPPSNPLYPYNTDNILGKNIPSSSSVPSIPTKYPTESFQPNVDPASALVQKIMSVFHGNTVPVSDMNTSAFPSPASLNTTSVSSSSFGVKDISMMQHINPQSNFPVTTFPSPASLNTTSISSSSFGVKDISMMQHINPQSNFPVTTFPSPASLNTTSISSSSFGVKDISMMQHINSQSNFPVTTVMSSSGYPYSNIPVAGSLDPRRAALGIQHHTPVESVASLNPFRNNPPPEPLDPRKIALPNSSNVPNIMSPMNPFRNFSPVESLDPRKASLGMHSMNSFKNSPSQDIHSQLLNSPSLAAPVQVPRKASCLVPQNLKCMVGYQTIETQSVLLLMLEWSVDWLTQQQKSHDPPPICKSLKKVVSSYENFEDYYNTYFPLMLLETWQRIYVSWTDLNQTTPYLCQITSYSVKSHYVSIECQSVFSTESRPKGVFPDEGSILMVKYSTKSNEYTIKILGYVTHVKTRYFNPVTDSKICSSLPIKSDTKLDTLQILTMTFMGAYNSEDIDKRQPVTINVLCNVKHTLKQNDALLYISKSPLHRSILNPVADALLTFSLTPRSSPEEKIHECVRDITKGILSPHPLPLLTIVRASPESDRFKIIPLLIQKMKNAYKTKVLLCVRTVRALGDIAANICLQQQSLKLVIINKRCDTNPQFQKYLLEEVVASEMKKDEEGVRKEKLNAKNEAYVKMKKQILKDCDVVLSLVRNSHDDFIGSTFLETESIPQMCCIIDEANLCTEPETLIPVLHGISKLILIGDPDYSAKVLSKAASSYDYNQSFFQRAYDLDLLTD